MKRSLFLTACFMMLSSLLFGQQHWTCNDANYESNMNVYANISIENALAKDGNYEVAAFYNDEVRGVAKVKTDGLLALQINGKNNEQIKFKLYDHNAQKELATDYKVNFKNNGIIGNTGLVSINFYKIHWDFEPDYDLDRNMTVTAVILKDGEVQNRSNLEVAAYINGTKRAVAKPVEDIDGSYLVDLFVCGTTDEESEDAEVTFKIYDFDTDLVYDAEYTTIFEDGKIEGLDEPVKMKFITRPYVAQIGEEKYQSLEQALKAITAGSTLTILEDITISEKWDNRYTGAKVSVPVTIDGNGKTIKFTGEINDGLNYTAAFRFEDATTIKNLTIDMSEATSNFSGRFSAVAAKLDITVDECIFIGNANYNNTKAIIFGEGAQDALADVKVNITESKFIDWKYGVSDNQNAQDAKNVTIAENVFKNASVNISASELVIFDGNKLDNGNVAITSYTNNTALEVEAINNTLDANQENSIKVDPTDKINAQEGILLPVAKIGSKYYLELDKAFAAAKAGDVVTVFSGTYDLPSMKAGITIEGEGEVLFEGTLTGTLENLTMKNIHIKGGNAQRWAYAKGDLVFENVIFEATGVYALHFDGITEGATLTYEDCTIIGWAAMSGSPASCTFDGCTFKGNGTYGLIRTYFDATIENCTFDVANVNTTDNYQDGIHAVSDAYVTVNNSTNVNGDMEDIVNVHALSIVNLDGVEIKNVAKIGDNYYLTLQEAVNAVEESATITMVADTKLAEKVVVPTGKAITLDLNNKTISQEKACTASYEMILNKGNLTITGEGVISFKDTSAGDPTFGWGSYTVRNEGTLVVENGTIEHLGEQEAHMICAIFQYSGSSTINGGTISTPNYRSARLWSGDMTINGGEFDGQLWLQAVNNTSKLTINGGTFTPNGGDASSVFVTNSQYDVVFAVTDGTFNGKIGCSNATKLAGCITGGTFSATAKENTASELIAMGYIFKEADVNGYYEVVDDPTTLYITNLEELKAFREAVNGGNTFAGITVYLAANIDLNNEEWAPIGSDKNHAFKGTFDGQEYTISNLKIENNALDCAGLFGYATNATIKNVNVKNVDIEAYSHVAPIAGHMYTGNIENCHVSGTINLVAQYAYAAGITADGYVNVRNCSVIAEGTGVITVVEKTGAGGITGWRGEGNLAIESCTVKNLDITAWASLGGITGIAQYNNVINGCTVENVKLTKTRENGQASVGLVSGNWTNKSDDNYTITMTNNHFDNMSINGTAITSLCQLYGSNYSYYDKVIKLVEENNTYGTITTDFKVVVKTLAELKNALAYVKAGETIELGANIEDVTEVLMISKSLTINGNDNSVSSNANRVFRVTESNTVVTLNGVNMVSGAAVNYPNDVRGISIDANLSDVQMTLNDCSVDFTDVSAKDWTYAVNVSGNGTGHEVTVNGGTYEGANVINVHGANNTIVVKDATLNSMYPNNDVYYGACIWVLQNQGSSVEATGNTFNGNNAVAFNLGTGTTLTESENIDNTKRVVAKIGDVYYTSVNEAINAAQDGVTVQLLAGTINEVIKPWAGDSQHTSEKSITIVGAENFGTTLTGGLYLGYDDSGCRAHTITINGIAFEDKGILVAGQQNVVIEGNKFTNITDVVSTSQSANANAISVIGKNINATVKNNVIENIAVAGINLRNIAKATVEGNTITNTEHNAITITETAGEGIISVINNKLSQWGLGEEKGRAIRISANKVVNINGNVMSHTAAPESFVKVIGLGTEEKQLNVDKNYWNGNNPIALFETDGKADPVSYLVGYYVAQPLVEENYVELSASVAKIGTKYYQSFASAIAAVQNNETIELITDCAENVTIAQKSGLSFIIKGAADKNYTGTITVKGDGKANNYNTETLTFQNINFTPAYNTYAITATKNTYARNITVDNCTFKADNNAYGIRVRNGYNYTVKNTTAEGMYTFFNASEALSGLTVENVTVKCSNVAFSAAYGMGDASFTNVTIYSDNNGVKVNNTNGSALTFEDCSITAKTPVTFIENAGITSSLTAEFNGTNNMVVKEGGEYWFDITDDAATDATFKAIVNDADLDMSNTAFEASIGNVYYSTLHKAIDVAVDGDVVTLARNIAYTSEDAILASGNLKVMVNVAGKNITLDMNGKEISLDHQSATDRIYAVVSVEDGASLTVKGEGSIDVDVNDATPKVAYMFLKRGNNGTLVIENGNFHMDDSEDSMVYTSGDEVVTVKGGTFILDAVGTSNNGSPWIFNANGQCAKSVIVQGGTFNFDVNHQYYSDEVYVSKEKALQKNDDNKWEVVDAVAYVEETCSFNKHNTRNVGYATLAEAVASEYGNNVTMLADVNEAVTISGKEITLDLNGKKVYSANSDVISVKNNANVTIKGGTLESAGYNCGGVYVNNSTLALNGCTFVGTNNEESCGVYASNGANVTIDNCELTANHYGLIMMGANVTINSGTFTAPLSVSANGSDDYDDATLTINGGTFNGGIYWPANGELTINDGIFTDETAVYVKSGSLEINGGTFTGTGVANNYAYTLSGFAATGDAIVIENVGGDEYDAIGTVSITGGTFTSVNAAPIASYTAGKNGVEAVEGFVIGGTFNKEIEAELCALGYICIPDGNGAYTIADDPSTLYITNLDELIEFRDDVNAGNDYAGITVYLAADIDMAGIDWSVNIGDDCSATFDGTFDGQGHKLMNLTSTETAQKADGYICTGLFGAIHGNAVLKDFTIENVTINTGDYTGNNVSAVVGFAYNVTGSIENVKVTGSININAPKATGVGAIIGYDYYSPALTVNNCVVAGNAGSTILGKSYVGGAVGYASTKIALNENTVENVSVTATGSVGAIAGIMLTGGSADANTIKNVALVATGELWANSAAVVAGTITSTGAVTVANTVVENVTANGAAASLVGGKLVEKPTTPIEKVEARIGNKYYATLEGALVAEGNDVTLLVPYVVEAGETVELDLNGKKVTGTPTEAKAYAVITNNGNLTIKNGSIICDHKLAGSTGYAVNAITNGGTLTIDGAIVENKSTAQYQIGYAIDNNSTTGNAVVVVKSGAVRASGSNYYDGIRQFCNSLTNENSVTINGGEVSTLWMQNPSDGAEKNTKDVKGSFAITGGKVGVVSTEPSANFSASITAGEVGRVEYFQTSEGRNLVGYITGGTFGMDVTDLFCAYGYRAEYNTEGNNYIVKLAYGKLVRNLGAGWNWFSSFVDIEGEDGLAKLEEALGTAGVQIKDNAGQTFVNYSSANGRWRGTLTATSSTRMYSINTSVEHTLEYAGDFYELKEYTPQLHEGWNYLAYPSYNTMSVEQAFMGYEPADGDVLKSKTSSVTYAWGMWIFEDGEAFDLTPGEGYMYYNEGDDKPFAYSTEQTSTRSSSRSYVGKSSEYWTVDASQYPSNMTMIATLDVEGTNYEVAAFVDGELRGSARPIYIEELDQCIIIMTINGEDVANVTFKYYDYYASEEYTLNNVAVYSNNAILGSVENPYALTRGTTGIGENSLNDINIYPNPTTTDREINLQATCDKVEVFNTLGVKVAEYQNVDTIDALETAGTYVIRVTLNGDVKHCRLIVK